MLVLYPGNNYGCRATQRIQAKAQSAGNGHCPLQGLQRRVGSSGSLPLGEPASGRPRRCASWQGRRPFPARRALRSTACQLAAPVIITWIEYYGMSVCEYRYSDKPCTRCKSSSHGCPITKNFSNIAPQRSAFRFPHIIEHLIARP